MSDIAFACPSCGQHLEAPTDLAGETVECPSCQSPMTVPSPTPASAPEPALPNPLLAPTPKAESDDGKCPECGAKLPEDGVLCMQCGFHTGLGKKIETSFE